MVFIFSFVLLPQETAPAEEAEPDKAAEEAAPEQAAEEEKTVEHVYLAGETEDGRNGAEGRAC